MSDLSNIFKIIIGLTFLYCIVEQMLPNKSFSKYVSFIYGIISLFIIVVGISNSDVKFDIDNYSYENFKNDNSTYVKEIYENKLSEMLANIFSDSTISVKLDDNYRISNIKCKNKETYENVMRYLNDSNKRDNQ